MMMPTRPKASARAMSRTTVRMGLSHLRLKSRGLTHTLQGNQDDERIENRKQAELHTGQQPHQERWNDRQGRPNHGDQACQSASQRQERRVWGPEQPVTQAQQQPGQETLDYLAAYVSADVRLDGPPDVTRLFALARWQQREPESFKMNLIDAPIDAQEQNDEHAAHDAADALREAEVWPAARAAPGCR